ncbi:MAG: N-6 DNA methylase [Verrucomicrobiota bacterium]|nr:N-6 DNA methylase [Verrucomicrobiota bacterium]
MYKASVIGQFFTPEFVAQSMFRMAGIRSGQKVIDPSCGDGVFVRSVLPGCEVFCCEIDPHYGDLVRPLLKKEHFVAGDALTDLLPFWGTFDLAIGNPPFSAQAHLEKRPQILRGFDLGFGRISQCLEILFLELFLKLAKPKGRIAIILPDGPLSNRPFKYVRDWLLCRAHVEAIVSLPRGIFTRTTAKTNILIAQKLFPAHQPYREPTSLLVCSDVNELKPLSLPDWRAIDKRWQKAVLADELDWRPEAHYPESRTTTFENVRLGDLFRLRTGFALYGRQRELQHSPAPNRILLIRAKNLAPEGGLRLNENCAYISRHGDAFCEDSLVRPGEILFVRVGAGCYGRAALMPAGLEAQADDWIHILTPTAEVDCARLVGWLNSGEGRSQIRRLAKGVGTLSISKASLAEMKIPVRFVRSNDLVLAEEPAPYGVRPRQSVGVRARRAVSHVPKATVRHPYHG